MSKLKSRGGRFAGFKKNSKLVKAITTQKAEKDDKPLDINLANAPIHTAHFIRAIAVNTCDIAKSLQVIVKALEKDG